MIDEISGSISASMMGGMQSPQQMSGSQRSLVQNTLAKFDANNLSAEEIKSINKTFRSEGIRPSAELKAEIETAGFDVEAMRSAGGPRGVGNPPPPPPPEQEDEESLSTFLELLEEYQDRKLDEKALQEIKDKWLEAGNSVGNSFVSITV
jgi:hypothetical protein